MDANDADRPVMTNLEGDTPPKDSTPLPPWLRRFASIVGFASAGSAPGANQAFS
jgi:hypothetical protein